MSDPLEQGEVHLDVLTDEPYIIEAKQQDEAAWAYTRAQIEAAVKRALEGAAEQADFCTKHGATTAGVACLIRALDHTQFIDGDKT